MENIKTTKIGQQIDKRKNKAKNAPKRIGAAAIGKVTLGKKKVYGSVELTKYFSDNRISQTRIAGYATKKKLVENKGFSLGSGSM